HDLARLAVAALGDLLGDPGTLDRMAAVVGESLDREDLLALGGAGGDLTGLLGDPLEGGSAGSALPPAAAPPCGGEVEAVAQHPEQRRVRSGVDGDGLPVDSEGDHRRRLEWR